MSQEYRNTVMKQVGQMAEAAKIKIRTQRQDARTALKRVKSMSSQDESMLEKKVRCWSVKSLELTCQIQEQTDRNSGQIEAASVVKTKEIKSS
jgi:ribosome recycling factor